MLAALVRGVLWTYIAFMTFGAVMALLALIVTLYIAHSYTPLRRLRLGDRVGVMPHEGGVPRLVVVAAHHDDTTTCVAMCGTRMVGMIRTPSSRGVFAGFIVRGEYDRQTLVDAATAAGVSLNNGGDDNDTDGVEFRMLDTRVCPPLVTGTAVARTYACALAMHLQHPARVIQRAWRLVVADPYTPVGRRRLLHEFNEGLTV
jgi:hypothetical protein